MVHSPLVVTELAPSVPGPQRGQRGQHRPYLEAVGKHLVVSWVGVRLSPLGTSATVWPIVPTPYNR
jgi:hypothetical protein